MSSVTWLTRYGPEGASARYRAYQFETQLRAAGWASVYEPLAPWRGGGRDQVAGVARRLGRLARSTGRDGNITVIQKEPVMPPVLWPGVAVAARHWRDPVLWDVDDAVWIGRPGAERLASSMAARTDAVVAGNPLIAEWVESRGARDVRVVPTCFEPRGSRHPIDDGVTRVVWVGSPATARLLTDVEILLREIASVPDTRLTFVGGEPPPAIAQLANVEVTAWSAEREHEALASADFGLGPQPRTPYADHKCGFKLVQYLAYGVIPIATDSPVHRWLLDGAGLLVGDGDESSAAEFVRTGVDDGASAAAIRLWRSRFSSARATAAWLQLLAEVAS